MASENEPSSAEEAALAYRRRCQEDHLLQYVSMAGGEPPEWRVERKPLEYYFKWQAVHPFPWSPLLFALAYRSFYGEEPCFRDGVHVYGSTEFIHVDIALTEARAEVVKRSYV